MDIQIQKDIDETYKDELVSGFSAKESLYILAGIGVAVGATFLIWKYTGMAPNACVYVGVPCAVPFLAMGFYRKQGLSLLGYIREMIYVKRTSLLLYDADEVPTDLVCFTMNKEQEKKSKWKRRKN